MTKIRFLFLFLLGFQSFAQTIEIPQFPTPEKQFYNLLEEDRIEHFQNLNGSIKQVSRNTTVFDTDAVVKSLETKTAMFNEEGKIASYFFNYNGNRGKTIYETTPKQEVDSIDGYKRITISAPEEGINEYWYKNNTLLKHIYSDDLLYKQETVFGYNSKNRLTQKRTFTYLYIVDDTGEPYLGSKNETEVELAFYDEDRLLSKEKYVVDDEDDIIDINKIQYEYDKEGLCSRYNYNYSRYVTTNIDWEKPLEKQTYQEDDFIKNESKKIIGLYKNDNKKRLKAFYIADTKHNDFTEKYEITYTSNQMTIDAIFREFKKRYHSPLERLQKRTRYQYYYDEYQNPIKVQSFAWSNGKKLLEKETTLEINYSK
ncbi:hypothetical protein [Pseudotenacibaculum haliotis]|uniref:YD repeat-containing protein n=1 Tax=Pseudotenacibaculum haliotis TaxID=1862138 RepID=A0ABW5LWF0_9FLAO